MGQPATIPAWQLYGETGGFPDHLHVERIRDRAAGLDWTIPPHRHLHLHQLFLIEAGAARLRMEGEERSLPLPGLVNVPRGAAHGFSFDAGTEGFVLTLPAQGFAELFNPESETSLGLSRSFLAPATPELAGLFDLLAQAHLGAAPFRRTLLRSLTGVVVAKALALAPDPRPTREAGDPRVGRFAAQVAAGEGVRGGVREHACALGVSGRHLSRLCRAATGLSARAFLEAARMREACSLLVYTRLTAAEVGYRLGFEDPAYFSRAFRRHAGESPSAYRARFEARDIRPAEA